MTNVRVNDNCSLLEMGEENGLRHVERLCAGACFIKSFVFVKSCIYSM